MKSKLARQVRSQKTLEKAWLAIQRNSRTSKSEDTKNEIATFAGDLQTNLRRISRQLQKQTFVFRPAKGLKIPKDKKDKASFRPLVVAKVESRIVQRAVHDVLVSVPAIEQFIRTPYSFGGIKKSKDDEMTAVPAAVQAVLGAISGGARYLIKSDISAFFTKIPKSAVTSIVSGAVGDDEFVELFSNAIKVELENMAQLRSFAKAFPIEDIGVAQGNSLSPLLGNIILRDFDLELNKDSDVRCIRYIDDFIILGSSKSVVENKYAKALHLLKKLDMQTSLTKTKRARTDAMFNFLGIEFANGLLRPSIASRTRMIESIKGTLSESTKAFRESRPSNSLTRSMSLLQTLNKVSGIMQGWAKHYLFCNDGDCLRHLDKQISDLIRNYLSTYREEREKADDLRRWSLLGIEALSQIERHPFAWNTQKASTISAIPTTFIESDDINLNAPPW